jgi:hypothetical protein
MYFQSLKTFKDVYILEFFFSNELKCFSFGHSMKKIIMVKYRKNLQDIVEMY